jgi:DNA-binding transcriptional LysR family regulator
VPVLPGWAAASRPVYLVYPTRRYVSARLRCFIDWATDAIRDAAQG